MARRHLPGGFYHVMLRGNRGQDVFFTKADRLRFLELLADGAFLERVTAAAEWPLRSPDLDTLIEQVAAAYGVAPSALATASRRRPLVEARGVISHLARDSGAASLTKAARRVGRDPTTLSHDVRHIELRAGQDPVLAQRIEPLNNTTLQA